MMRYKTKFNLLRDEVVKANNELVDNKVFENYINEEQDTIMITNCIVKALVKTIKFYEEADRKLDSAVEYALSDCSEYLKDNLIFKNRLRYFISIGMDHREATARALYFTIADINKTVDNLQDLNTSLISEKDELEEQVGAEQTRRKDSDQICDRLSNYITKLEREKDELAEANLKQFLMINERNNEIDALKHMLDRKDIHNELIVRDNEL